MDVRSADPEGIGSPSMYEEFDASKAIRNLAAEAPRVDEASAGGNFQDSVSLGSFVSPVVGSNPLGDGSEGNLAASMDSVNRKFMMLRGMSD